MASSIEVVPIVASAVASDVPSEILPVKRVRKAIVKAKSPEVPAKMPKTHSKNEESVATIPKIIRARAKKIIPEANVGETNPTNDANGNNSARNIVNNGPEATIISKNSENDSSETIVDEEMPDAGSFLETNGNSSAENSSGSDEPGNSSQKRGRGRPLGSKDKQKRAPRGSLNKPPVQHGKLGRPPGSKNKATIALEQAVLEVVPQPVAAPIAAATVAARNVVASTYVPQPKVAYPPATCRETVRRMEANHIGGLVTKMFHA